MALSYSFLQSATSTADSNSYTFSSQSLGTADADRYIVVSAIARKAGAGFTLTGITVGGIEADIVKQVTNTITNSDCAALVIAAVPTGTTGDVVVTWSTTVLRCAIGMWRLVGIESAIPYDSDSSTAADPSVALDVLENGVAIGAGLTAASSSATWTGLTENFDGTLETFVTYTGAGLQLVADETGRTITIDFASSTESAGVFASWQEAIIADTSVKDIISSGFIPFAR